MHVDSQDPATAIGHKENGSHSQTQKTVISQEGFPQLVEVVLSKVVDGAKGIAVYCRAGCHRSDTAARMVEDPAWGWV